MKPSDFDDFGALKDGLPNGLGAQIDQLDDPRAWCVFRAKGAAWMAMRAAEQARFSVEPGWIAEDRVELRRRAIERQREARILYAVSRCLRLAMVHGWRGPA